MVMKKYADKNRADDSHIPAQAAQSALKQALENEEDADAEISEQDLQDLENADRNLSSDESQSADMLDNEDDEGVTLNEGPDEADLFDTGEDLDISEETLFPDIDPDSDNP
jgi:hypothetical protein